jgi:hypothetical protein
VSYSCANPECLAPFNYREGHIYCFHQDTAERAPTNSHAVKHFWLCRDCFKTYALEYRSNELLLRARYETPRPSPQKARLPRRSAARLPKAARKRAAASSALPLTITTALATA